jgi:hypothetical protein
MWFAAEVIKRDRISAAETTSYARAGDRRFGVEKAASSLEHYRVGARLIIRCVAAAVRGPGLDS